MADISGMKRVHTNIDLLMHDNGVKNDTALAEELGMSQQQLSQKLRGNLTMNTLETIAKYFKVTVKELLR